MSDSTAIEDDIYDFIAEGIAAAPANSLLSGAELHDTVYRTITQDYGIRIGDGDSELTPGPGAVEMLEVNGVVPIVIFSLVAGPDRGDRKAARSRMIALAKAVAMLFKLDPMMNARVNDSKVERAPRGWDSIESKPYSVANIDLKVNETGGQIK